MTNRSIEELAQEVADDFSPRLDGFEIDHVTRIGDFVKIRFSWRLPFYVEVTVGARDSDTDESVKDLIRRQLQARGLRFAENPSRHLHRQDAE